MANSSRQHRKKLPAYLIQYLNFRVVDQFKKEYQDKYRTAFTSTNEAELYGFDSYDPYSGNETNRSAYSVKSAMGQNKEVERALLRHEDNKGHTEPNILIDSKYLWKKKEVAKSGPTEARIAFFDKYLDVCLAYLGIDQERLEQDYSNAFEYYVGFYFSITGFTIRTLVLAISQFPVAENRRSANLRGVHVKNDTGDNEIYEGEAFYERKWLYINLKGREFKRRINIIGAVDEQEKQSMTTRFIRSTMQGTTADDRLFAWEVFFCKTPKSIIEAKRTQGFHPDGPVFTHVVSEDIFKKIAFYLIFHRNVITLSSNPLNQALSDLTSRGSHVSTFTQLSGEYRLWNFNFHQNRIVQSKFTILPNGTAFLDTYVPEERVNTVNYVRNPVWREDQQAMLKKQSALLNLSKIHRDNLNYKVIAITFSSGLNMVNVAMFDFERSADVVIKGSFATLGYNNYGNISGYFVMKKEEQPDQPYQKKKTIEVKEMNIDEAIDYARQHNLIPLLKGLVGLQNQNLWEVSAKNKEEIGAILSKVNAL